MDQFQKNPDLRVALLSITAAGVGITLTAAHTVVFVELSFTPVRKSDHPTTQIARAMTGGNDLSLQELKGGGPVWLRLKCASSWPLRHWETPFRLCVNCSVLLPLISTALISPYHDQGMLSQAEDRVYRIGQQASEVNIYYLLSRPTYDYDMWYVLPPPLLLPWLPVLPPPLNRTRHGCYQYPHCIVSRRPLLPIIAACYEHNPYAQHALYAFVPYMHRTVGPMVERRAASIMLCPNLSSDVDVWLQENDHTEIRYDETSAG